MAYSRRQLRCIELGLCLDCNERSAGAYRRCMRCRRARQQRTPFARLCRLLETRRMSYARLREKRLASKVVNRFSNAAINETEAQ